MEMPKKIIPSAYDVIHGTYDVILAKNNVKNENFYVLPIYWLLYGNMWRRYKRHEIFVFRAPPTLTDSNKFFNFFDKNFFSHFSKKIKKLFFNPWGSG